VIDEVGQDASQTMLSIQSIVLRIGVCIRPTSHRSRSSAIGRQPYYYAVYSDKCIVRSYRLFGADGAAREWPT
jgi:hypothetical protein